MAETHYGQGHLQVQFYPRGCAGDADDSSDDRSTQPGDSLVGSLPPLRCFPHGSLPFTSRVALMRRWDMVMWSSHLSGVDVWSVG